MLTGRIAINNCFSICYSTHALIDTPLIDILRFFVKKYDKKHYESRKLSLIDIFFAQENVGQ